MTRTAYQLGVAILMGAMMTTTAVAGEIGHFVPGVANIRDYAVPEPGFYGAVYNYSYRTQRLNDAGGSKISSVTLGPGPGVTLSLGVDVKVYALAPTFIWATPKKVLGARYAALVTPTFTNASLNGLISIANQSGQKVSAGQFNVGDTYVQPVWLGWAGKHYDAAYSYGFYIPSGKYKIATVNVPLAGPVRLAAADNTGLGFWTNQNQGSLYIYPWADKRMAIQNSLTWEIHRKKRGFDLTPGQTLTYNWGLSQFVPLKKDLSLLAEVGPAGYNTFQVSNDGGREARNPTVHDRVSAAGVQVGLTLPKRSMVLNFHWFHEYSAVDRFQGNALGLNFVAKF
jgi:hypothetical protein